MQSFSDFCSKNFTFDHSVKTVHKASGGVKIENTATSAATAFKSSTKVSFPAASGKAEVQITANGPDKDTKAKYEFPTFQGVRCSVTATAEPNVTVETNYSPHKSVGTKVELVTDMAEKRTVNTSVNFSSNGIKATVDKVICLTTGTLKDYNLKVDYSQKSLLATAKTSKGRGVLTAGVAQQCCAGWYWGAQVEHTLKDSSTLMTVGTKYSLDSATTCSVKADTTGALAAAIEHKLSNPSLKVNAATQFNMFGTKATAEKYGLGLTFGDF